MTRIPAGCLARNALVGLLAASLTLLAGCTGRSVKPAPVAERQVTVDARPPSPDGDHHDGGDEEHEGDGTDADVPMETTAANVGVRSKVEAILASQRKLDETIWRPEVLAQQYETVFVDFWDRVRESKDKLGMLASLPFNVLRIGSQGTEQQLEWEITIASWEDSPVRAFTQAAWAEQLEKARGLGIEVIDTEWHHSRFVPAAEGPAESTISFVIHAQSADERYRVTGNLEVRWAATKADGPAARIDRIDVTNLKLLRRPAAGFFKRVLTVDHATLRPILCYDLNADNLVDIVLPMMNALFINKGSGSFEREPLFPVAPSLISCAQIADYDGDGRPDLLVSQVTYEAEEEVRTHATLRVYLNQHVTDNGWVGVHVVKGETGRSPVGATVTVETDLGTQRQWLLAGDALYGQESNIAHFGLGRAARIKSITVRWPGGQTERLESPEMRKYHMVRGDR